MTPLELTDPATSTESLAALLNKDDATNRLIAKHPKAGAVLLEKLSHSSDRTTRALVTANPDTPPSIYLRLGAQFPSEFLANPMLDLLFLENPALLQDLSDNLLVQVLRRPNCPQDFLVWAAGHASEKVQLAVAMNGKASQQAIERLSTSIHSAVKEAVSHKPHMHVDADTAEPLFRQAVKDWLGSLSFEDAKTAREKRDIGLAQLPYLSTLVWLLEAGMSRELLVDLDDGPLWMEQMARCFGHVWLAGRPDTSAAVLNMLAKDKDDDVRYSVAKNLNTSIDVLEVLAKDKDDDVRHSVAENLNTPIDVLEVLANDEDSDVRCAVAENPTTPIALLEVLAKDEDDYNRTVVAKRSNTSATVLEMLAKDNDAEVRLYVSVNSNTSATVIEMLANDEDSDVRCAVAENPNTPFALLKVLVKDKEVDVRSCVAANLSTSVVVLENLAKDKKSEVRRRVAENPNTPIALLEAFAKDKDAEVRRGVAENPNTSIALLEVLAKDESIGIRRGVAENPNTPIALLQALAKDKDAVVRRRFAENPNTPIALLQALAKDKDALVRSSVARNPNCPGAALELLAKDKDDAVRCRVAENLNTPIAVLEVLAKDKDALVRSSVARNPNCPVAALELLAKDKDYMVRSYVAENPSIPVVVLEVLSMDNVTSIRSQVAINPLIPEIILQRLANDTSLHVRCLVICNPATPTALADAVRNVLLCGDLRRDPWYQEALNKADEATKAAVAEDNLLFFQVEDPDRLVLSTRPTAKLAALCSGPYVTPERIARVSGSTDWLIRAAVARNAGTPPNLLRKLTADGHPLVAGLAKLALGRANQSTSEVTSVQPVLRIDRIVADLVSRLRALRAKRFSRDKVWGRLCTVSDVWIESNEASDFLRQQMDASEWERLWLMRVEHNQPERREQLARRTDIPVTALAVLARDWVSKVRCAVAENPITPVAVLEALAKDVDPNVRSGVGKHPSTSIALLDVLLRDQFSVVRVSTAVNPNTPGAALEGLAKDKDIYVRRSVAKNPNTSVPVLKVLADDASSDVRGGVAQNPNTPLAVLEVLADDASSDVRGGVAQNPNTPLAVLEVLAREKDERVRREVATYPNTPVTVLEMLAIDNDVDVRSCVAKHTNLVAVLEVLAEDAYSDVRCGVAQNPNTPVTVLEMLAKEKGSVVRRRVAENPNTPVAVLEVLAESAYSDVRCGVAQNPNTPVAVLEVLGKSKVRTPQTYLADIRQALEMETQLELGVEPQFDDVETDDILRGVMLLGALSRHADNKELTAASRSTDWLTRLGVALHPNASEVQLKLLCQDADVDVMAAAVMRLHPHPNVPVVPIELATLVTSCPTCKGLVKEGIEGYSCVGPQDGQEGQGCGFAFKKTHAGRTFTVGEAEQLVRDGRIGPLKGFISKAGAPFAAQMCFMFNNSSKNYRLQFDFGNDKKSDQTVAAADFSNQTSLGQCPKCSSAVYEQEQDYVCINSVASPTNPKRNCNFKTGKVVLQQPISQEQVGKLLSTGRTDLLDGFVSSRTQNKFTAMLVWDPQAGKVNFEFG